MEEMTYDGPRDIFKNVKASYDDAEEFLNAYESQICTAFSDIDIRRDHREDDSGWFEVEYVRNDEIERMALMILEDGDGDSPAIIPFDFSP